MMKKIISVLVVSILTISLSSCATIKKSLKLSQEKSHIQSIEIYNTDHSYDEGSIHVFREKNKPIVVLKKTEISAFLDVLRALKFEKEVVFFPIPMSGGCDYDGYVIAVVYSDGGYDIIAEEGLYSYAVGKDGQGRHKYDHSDYCGKKPWSEIFGEYIEK